MPPGPLQILYEDNHLLAVNKPAGLATMGAPAGKPTLLEIARQYVKEKYHKPGNVYLGVVSRLDAPVTGVVLLARTSKAAARLTEQFRTKSVQKFYWAVVEGVVRQQEGRCVDHLVHDDRHRRMHLAEAGTAGAKEARLAYRRLSILQGPEAKASGPPSLAGGTLLEVELETGRKHQIRLQLARLGHPVVGDRKYGSQRKCAAGIALHSRRLVLLHPVRGVPVEVVAPLPAYWRHLGVDE